jgi:hypothetical protein
VNDCAQITRSAAVGGERDWPTTPHSVTYCGTTSEAVGMTVVCILLPSRARRTGGRRALLTDGTDAVGLAQQ